MIVHRFEQVVQFERPPVRGVLQADIFDAYVFHVVPLAIIHPARASTARVVVMYSSARFFMFCTPCVTVYSKLNNPRSIQRCIHYLVAVCIHVLLQILSN